MSIIIFIYKKVHVMKIIMKYKNIFCNMCLLLIFELIHNNFLPISKITFSLFFH